MNMAKGIANFILPAAEKPKKKTKPRITKPKTAKKHIQVEEPKIFIDPEDFCISSVVDGTGIHVITKFLGQAFNVFTLPRNMYDSWLRSSPQQRISYVSAQTSETDARIKQMIVNETINVINRIFARAR